MSKFIHYRVDIRAGLRLSVQGYGIVFRRFVFNGKRGGALTREYSLYEVLSSHDIFRVIKKATV